MTVQQLSQVDDRLAAALLQGAQAPGLLAEALRGAREAHARVQALRRALVLTDALDPEAEQALAAAVEERAGWHGRLGARLMALLDRLEAANKTVGPASPALQPAQTTNNLVVSASEADPSPELDDEDLLSDEPTEEFKSVVTETPPTSPPPAPPPSPPAAAADIEKLLSGFGQGQPKGWSQAQPAPRWPDRELERLGPPCLIDDPDAFSAERGRLRAVINERQAWTRLGQAEHRRLLSLVAHRLRHLQDEAAAHADGVPLDADFLALTQHSAQHRPGFVTALSRAARPKRSSWLAEAQADWAALTGAPPARPAEVVEALREMLAEGDDDNAILAILPKKLPVGPDRLALLEVLAPHAARIGRLPGYATLKAALKEHLAVEEAEEAQKDRALPAVPAALLARTAGKRALIVGGDKRGEAQARVLAGLQLKSLDWETGEGVRRASSTAERCKKGSFDLVIFLKRFISHKLTDQVFPSCGPAVEVLWIEQGYGLSAVVRALSTGGGARAR
jgi:hypothetical protein